MTELRSDFIGRLVAATQGVELDDTAAARVARTAAGVAETMRAITGRSLFDTEPAKFDAMLAHYAEPGKSDD